MSTEPSARQKTSQSMVVSHARIPTAFLRNPNISLRAKGLYAILASYAGSAGTCTPSRETLAAHANVSLSTVKRILRELKEAGAIEITQRTGTSSLYALQPLIKRGDAKERHHPITREAMEPKDIEKDPAEATGGEPDPGYQRTDVGLQMTHGEAQERPDPGTKMTQAEHESETEVSRPSGHCCTKPESLTTPKQVLEQVLSEQIEERVCVTNTGLLTRAIKPIEKEEEPLPAPSTVSSDVPGILYENGIPRLVPVGYDTEGVPVFDALAVVWMTKRVHGFGDEYDLPLRAWIETHNGKMPRPHDARALKRLVDECGVERVTKAIRKMGDAGQYSFDRLKGHVAGFAA